MTKKLQIRGMRPDDRAAFEALTVLREGYDVEKARHRTDVIWHIAFENPVKDDKPTYLVATDGERLLCHMARMPTRFWLKGEPHLAAFAHDLFAHPELQATGAGFFTTMKLYKTMEDTCDSFAGLLWTNQINIKLQQTRKYEQLWVKRWSRPLEVTQHLRRLVPALPDAAASALGRLSRIGIGFADRALATARHAAHVEPLHAADARFDRLAARVGPKLGVAPVKDAAYVHWKYFTWPHLPLTVLAVPDRDELRGFIVLRDAGAGEIGRVLDLAADPEDHEALDALVGAALGHYRQRGAAGVECIATAPALGAALRRFYFAQRPPETPLFFLNGHKAPDVEHLRKLESWGHVYGDSEGGEVP